MKKLLHIAMPNDIFFKKLEQISDEEDYKKFYDSAREFVPLYREYIKNDLQSLEKVILKIYST